MFQHSRENTLVYQSALSSRNRSLKLNADSEECDSSGVAILREIGPLPSSTEYEFFYGDLIHLRGWEDGKHRPLDYRLYWSNAALNAIQAYLDTKDTDASSSNALVMTPIHPGPALRTVQNSRSELGSINNSVVKRAMSQAEDAGEYGPKSLLNVAITGGGPHASTTGFAVSASNKDFSERAALERKKMERLIYANIRESFKCFLGNSGALPDEVLRLLLRVPDNL